MMRCKDQPNFSTSDDARDCSVVVALICCRNGPLSVLSLYTPNTVGDIPTDEPVFNYEHYSVI